MGGKLGAGGLGSRLAKGAGIGGVAGVAGLAAGAAGDMATDAGYKKTGAGLQVGSAALQGAGMGAMIGSVIPVAGTLVGAAVGGALGAGYGLYQNFGALTGDGGNKASQGKGGEMPKTAANSENKKPGPDDKLLSFLAKHESGGNPNILVGGKTKTNPSLSEMTVAEVDAFQKQMIRNGFETSAVGKYQIINETLGGLIKKGVISPNDRFDSNTQEKAAIGLLNRRGREKFKSGGIDADNYANNVAKEWASMPMPNGKSYYEGTGSNKAGASRSEFINSIVAEKGGLASGPRSGYPATLHGNEMIVPLDPTSILAELGKKSATTVSADFSKNNESMQQLISINQGMVEILSTKLDSVIDHLSSSNNTQSKILKRTSV
jgi:hypothetical protein